MVSLCSRSMVNSITSNRVGLRLLQLCIALSVAYPTCCPLLILVWEGRTLTRYNKKWNGLKWDEISWHGIKLKKMTWNKIVNKKKSNETKWREVKWMKIKWEEMKRNKTKWNEMQLYYGNQGYYVGLQQKSIYECLRLPDIGLSILTTIRQVKE